MDLQSYTLFCQTVKSLAASLHVEVPDVPARESLETYAAISFYNKMLAKPPSLRKYAITLTTEPLPKKPSKKYLQDRQEALTKVVYTVSTSKLVDPSRFDYSFEHPDTNLHCHIYLETSKYIKARDILRMNKGNRVDVKLLKGVEAAKWLNYIAKETQPKSLV